MAAERGDKATMKTKMTSVELVGEAGYEGKELSGGVEVDGDEQWRRVEVDGDVLLRRRSARSAERSRQQAWGVEEVVAAQW